MTENFGQMDQMSMGLLLIVSVSGLVILVLVFLFWIKNRTQEIGIMMSLGKCKFEIWVQFLWEAVMISIIGMLLSFAISPIIAETSASYLAKETQTLRLEQQEQENTGTYIDGYIAPDLKNTRCGGSYNERNGSDGYWDDIRYFDYCSISSRNHDNEEKGRSRY